MPSTEDHWNTIVSCEPFFFIAIVLFVLIIFVFGNVEQKLGLSETVTMIVTWIMIFIVIWLKCFGGKVVFADYVHKRMLDDMNEKFWKFRKLDKKDYH